MNSRQLQANLKRYHHWWLHRTQAEIDLQAEALKFEEEYFSDLRLLDSSVAHHLTQYKVQDDDGQWVDAVETTNITIDKWIISHRHFQDLGECRPHRREIFISHKLSGIESHATLLHELIHAYESQLCGPYREWFVLDLYRRMAEQIAPETLNRYIDISTHAMVHHAAHGGMAS
jgi:hypothetical protein